MQARVELGLSSRPGGRRVDRCDGLSRFPAATQTLPAAPCFTALPAGATRLEAWRQGSGGAPELLLIGEQGTLEVVIPAEYTFDPGDSYTLWLQARNSRGSSTPGPKQTWTAS